jgi:hypothetical protein
MVAKRFDMSLALVKKLLSQRKRMGTIEPLHHRAGRTAKLEPEHGRLGDEVKRKPESTLAELKQALGLEYTPRYADDFVCAFRFEEDAKRFESQLPQRLGKFNLEVAPDKTRTLPFSRQVPEPNEAFEFLGFEFRWVKARNGTQVLRRRTAPKKLRASVRAFAGWIKKKRHSRMKELMKTLAAKLRGYWNYYGVRGNMESLNRFYRLGQELLHKWLNRRSQRRSYTFEQIGEMLRRYAIPAPHIAEPAYQRELL